jgi:hypothetical protein
MDSRDAVIRELATKTYLSSFVTSFVIVCSPSLTALLDRPRGGTLAPAGRWLCERNSMADLTTNKRTNLINSQVRDTQSIDSVHETTRCFKYTSNLFVSYADKLQRI